MAGGRPTKYKPEYCRQAKMLCELGAIDTDLAAFFQVNQDTINEWKKKHPKFSESLKEGKDIVDNKVVRSLFERATGYEHPEVHVSNYQGEITLTPLTKHYPPDPTSMIFWLKNRRKDEWRDKQDHEVTGKDGGEIRTITRTIIDPKGE